ncbi:MAG: hypothetical protein J6V44_09655 [Methanobrevibacter sp.]|nr:hypothetical protein [Methanobrevibacter sp.]
MKNERMIRKCQTMYNVKAVAINLDTLETSEKVFTAKKNSTEFIEKRFNELFKEKFVKVTAIEETETDWRECPESLFVKHGTSPADGFEVKATVWKSKIEYYYFDGGDIDDLKKSVIMVDFKIDDETVKHPNNLKASHFGFQRIALVEKITTFKTQYGMSLDKWKEISTPCEPPKKRK